MSGGDPGPVVLAGAGALAAAVGTDLGAGPWIEVSQEMIDAFADLTGDHQWIHVDRDRAAAGPFGTTIAHGYLTLSLLPTLTDGIYRVEGFSSALNYGADRILFPSAVPAGARLQARVTLAAVEPKPGSVQATYRATLCVEGADKPACVVDYLSRYLT